MLFFVTCNYSQNCQRQIEDMFGLQLTSGVPSCKQYQSRLEQNESSDHPNNQWNSLSHNSVAFMEEPGSSWTLSYYIYFISFVLVQSREKSWNICFRDLWVSGCPCDVSCICRSLSCHGFSFIQICEWAIVLVMYRAFVWSWHVACLIMTSCRATSINGNSEGPVGVIWIGFVDMCSVFESSLDAFQLRVDRRAYWQI